MSQSISSLNNVLSRKYKSTFRTNTTGVNYFAVLVAICFIKVLIILKSTISEKLNASKNSISVNLNSIVVDIDNCPAQSQLKLTVLS